MAIMKMAALTMVGPREEMDAVARQMVLTSSFQPLPLDILMTDRTLRSKVTTVIENPYNELLAKAASIWEAAGEPLPEPTTAPLAKDMTLAKIRETVSVASDRLIIWDERRKALVEEEEVLTAGKIFFGALKELDLAPEELAANNYVMSFFGRISAEDLERLAESAEEAPIIILELLKSNLGSWVLVITVSTHRETARKLLDAVYFKEFSFADIMRGIDLEKNADPLPILERRIKSRARAVTGLTNAAKGILREKRAEYELLYSMLYTLQRVYDLCRGRGQINGMFALSGWIPEDTLSEIRETIEKEAPKTMLLVEKSSKIAKRGVRVPTLLKNSCFFRTFQEIVAMYSLPSYGEIDPSPIVAVTFTLFFGFMFGDIGHGLMILLGSSYMVRRGLMSSGIGAVLKIASISSMIFGALYGSVFGMEDIIPAIWLSPLHDTNVLLAVAICIGIFMISLGMILNMVKQFKAGNFGLLFFDGSGLAGLLLYWLLVIAAASKITGAQIPSKIFSLILAAVIFMLLIMVFKDFLVRRLLRQKSGTHSTVMNIFEVIHSLLGFLSNTASFVRLAAFALNHAGLSMAVIMLSDMVRKLPGGIVMKTAVFIIGNLVIVCLEGLIVFIQTLRLEYYEFFGKFYKGGGSAFRPIGWKR